MKSPADLSARLVKQWHRSKLRAERLLSAEPWPLHLSVGKPTGGQFVEATAKVQAHVQNWKQVTVGTVIWQSVKFRASSHSIDMPITWVLNNPSEWVEACADAEVQAQFQALEFIANHVDKIYHELLIVERKLWRNKQVSEIVTIAQVADSLNPRAARGKPLRLLSGHGVDTKFFERHELLLTRLLDERFQGAASEQGLLTFLDALDEHNHWLLLLPLGPGLLPFKRQRVTSKELSDARLPATNILVIENEQCAHQLPKMDDTIAILGAGLDLRWLKSTALTNKQVAYWGDMDTWGLLMLARARKYCPHLTPLMMNLGLFQRYGQSRSVPEPVDAGKECPIELTALEADFYQYLLHQKSGRLEQEYLPDDEVALALGNWAGDCI